MSSLKTAFEISLYFRKELGSAALMESLFTVEMFYGEDLVVFKWGNNESDCIVGDATAGNKLLKIDNLRRGEQILTGIYERELKTTMMLHPRNSKEKFYLSLNRILNSMRLENPDDRLLDCDQSFNSSLLKFKKDIDDVLTASYSFYLLVTKSFLSIQDPGRIKILFEDGRLPEIQEKLDLFRTAIVEKKPDGVISVETWDFFLQEKRTELERLKAAAIKEKNKTPFEEQLVIILKLRLVSVAIPQNGDLEPEKLILSGPGLSEFDRLQKLWTEDKSAFEGFLSEVLSFGCLTSKLVTQCLNEPAMVLIRATETRLANRMKATFCLARKISQDFSIEFVQDFGERGTTLKDHLMNVEKIESKNEKEPTCRLLTRIQKPKCRHLNKQGTPDCDCSTYQRQSGSLSCSRCSHVHQPLNSYEDLDGLPCLLILVDNGRMGDTFPSSLQCMDLRLQHIRANQKPYLSTFVQEMGRMCRYTTLDSVLPRALLGAGIYRFLEKSLKDRATFYSPFLSAGYLIDRYVKFDERRNCLVPTDKSADADNDSSNRKNHLLLQAEPQIGKTGTYLAILGELRKRIKGDEAEEADDDRDESESSDDNDDDDADGKKMEVGIGHQLCRFPYWKDILNMPPLPEVINRCKYDRFDGGVFRYPSHTPRPIKDPLERRKAKRFKVNHYVQIDPKMKKFPTHKYDHTCSVCPSEGPSDVREWSFGDFRLKVSLPDFSEPYRVLGLLLDEQASDSTLNWILTPSFGRHNTARLNLHHTMTNEFGVLEPYAHLIFVRKEEFELYCSRWQHSHAIITLPDLLDDDETVDSGGVGFARKFIQLFSQRVGIKNYLQMDDNIRGFVAFEESSVSGQIITSHEPTEVGLSKILRTFDSLSKSRSTKLFWPVAFEPHGANPDKSLVESFTGPWQDFGVLGVRKYRHHNFKVFQNSYSRFHFDFCRLF